MDSPDVAQLRLWLLYSFALLFLYSNNRRPIIGNLVSLLAATYFDKLVCLGKPFSLPSQNNSNFLNVSML